MIGEFYDLIKLRHKIDPPVNEIDALDWAWPKTDDGCWTGPRENWINEHSVKWFKHVKKFDIAVQAGGACGMYPRLLSDRFDTVYTFEPEPLSFYCLVNNCQKKNIIKINGALGDQPRMVGIVNYVPDNVGVTRVQAELGRIPQLPLDCFDLPHCDLLALDIEGGELAALHGAIETIKKCKPVIVIEAGNRGEIITFLASISYHFKEQSAMDFIFTIS